MKQVRFVLHYGMVAHGLAPLLVDDQPTELAFWGFSKDVVRRLTRLSALYDHHVEWQNTGGRGHRMPERDRREFNALLAFVASEVQIALGDHWDMVLETEPL